MPSKIPRPFSFEDYSQDKLQELQAVQPMERATSFVEKTNPFKAAGKLRDSMNPGTKIALGTAAGAAAGYTMTPALANMIIGLMFLNRSEEERARIYEMVSNNSRLRGIGTFIGAIGGGVLGGGLDLDFRNGWEGVKNSLKENDYFLKNRPNYLQERTNKQLANRDRIWYTSKQASEFNDPYYQEIIPIRNSLDILTNDAYLKPYQRRAAADLIYGAENKDTGLTSGKKLTRSALKAGIGFVPAYAFGKTVGGILGLPPVVTTRMSMLGGLAAATINSGIFSK